MDSHDDTSPASATGATSGRATRPSPGDDGLWDGTWAVCPDVAIDAPADAEGPDRRPIIGMVHLPPGVRSLVATHVGRLTGPIDVEITLSTSGGAAVVGLRGDPSLVEVIVRGAGPAALDTTDLRLCHQPIIDLRTGRSVGAEAFLRIADPVAGTRRPGRFLDGLTDPTRLTDLAGWVLDRSLAQLTTWDRAGLAPLSMWLNLSGPELDDPTFVERVAVALAGAGIDPGRIHLELPEPRLTSLDHDGIGRLHDLAATGIELGIDDFGTGTAPIDLLRSLPVRFLKIDRSIGSRVRQPGGRAVVDAILGIGRALGVDLVAEGIEDPKELELLAQLGCTHAQGNLIATPARAESLHFDDPLLGRV